MKSGNGAFVVCGLYGEGGGRIIDDTKSYDGEFSFLYPLTDCVIEKIVLPDFKGKLNGVTLKAGIPFSGYCTTVKLVSGILVAYNRIVSLGS